MCPATDESSPNPEDPKQDSDEVSLQRLNEAFAEMLGSEPGDLSAEGVLDDAVDGLDREEGDNAGDMPDGDAAASAGSDSIDPLPKRIVEAMLFVGHPENESLKREQLARAIHGLEPEEVDDLIDELQEEYLAAKSAYEIVYSDGGYRMVIREEFEKVRDRFYGPIREAKLSQAAVEVLALVAYNQPTTSEKISQLRGHPSGSILSQLVRRQLLRFEKPEKKPRTPVYHTTPRFLKLFGLSNLEELPKNQELDD